jgi:hypothetical protein
LTQPVPPALYTCLNCPQKPQFITKDSLVAHWQATHTVSMVETVDHVVVLGQSIALPQVVVAKHVTGPDV